MKNIIDLRSDTVTMPCKKMREAMATAVVDDDVLGHDPTTHELEKLVTKILGKEAALFVPTGTMANQIALSVHSRKGDELFLDQDSHISFYEGGGPAVHSGLWPRYIPAVNGVFSLDDLRKTLRPENNHFPRPSLVVVENTHNRGGGKIWPIENIREISKFVKGRGMKMHLDGARLWNAVVASNIPAHEWCELFDSVQVCFSKGLGAPVGSAIVGSAEFIAEADRVRKLMGGGMRQSGIIAAGALYALKNNLDRLADDHANARLLYSGLQRISPSSLRVDVPETNMVFCHLQQGMDAAKFASALEKEGVRTIATGGSTIRCVTSLMVDKEDILKSLEVWERVFKNWTVSQTD